MQTSPPAPIFPMPSVLPSSSWTRRKRKGGLSPPWCSSMLPPLQQKNSPWDSCWMGGPLQSSGPIPRYSALMGVFLRGGHSLHHRQWAMRQPNKCGRLRCHHGNRKTNSTDTGSQPRVLGRPCLVGGVMVEISDEKKATSIEVIRIPVENERT